MHRALVGREAREPNTRRSPRPKLPDAAAPAATGSCSMYSVLQFAKYSNKPTEAQPHLGQHYAIEAAFEIMVDTSTLPGRPTPSGVKYLRVERAEVMPEFDIAR